MGSKGKGNVKNKFRVWGLPVWIVVLLPRTENTKNSLVWIRVGWSAGVKDSAECVIRDKINSVLKC